MVGNQEQADSANIQLIFSARRTSFWSHSHNRLSLTIENNDGDVSHWINRHAEDGSKTGSIRQRSKKFPTLADMCAYAAWEAKICRGSGRLNKHTPRITEKYKQQTRSKNGGTVFESMA